MTIKFQYWRNVDPFKGYLFGAGEADTSFPPESGLSLGMYIVAFDHEDFLRKDKNHFSEGAKKDFIDLYCIVKMKYSIQEMCRFFKARFKQFDVNYYHVLKSLVFFEDAEQDPCPRMLVSGPTWTWEHIKAFFIKNIGEFERALYCKTAKLLYFFFLHFFPY